MIAWIDTLVQFVGQNSWIGYAILFLAAMLEAVPIVGSFVPGSTIILALSGLVPSGTLNLFGVLTSAAIGAVLGDGVAFWTGHRAQREILTSWPLSKTPKLVEQSERFFEKRGVIAVLLGRFVPPIRAFVPITAGAVGMPPRRFYPTNIIAVLLWAPLHVLPGVFAVSAVDRLGGIDGMKGELKHYWFLIVMLLGCSALVFWLWSRHKAAHSDTPL